MVHFAYAVRRYQVAQPNASRLGQLWYLFVLRHGRLLACLFVFFFMPETAGMQLRGHSQAFQQAVVLHRLDRKQAAHTQRPLQRLWETIHRTVQISLTRPSSTEEDARRGGGREEALNVLFDPLCHLGSLSLIARSSFVLFKCFSAMSFMNLQYCRVLSDIHYLLRHKQKTLASKGNDKDCQCVNGCSPLLSVVTSKGDVVVERRRRHCMASPNLPSSSIHTIVKSWATRARHA